MGLKIGFNFVPYPQEIWDQGIELSHNGFKLLGYLSRHLITFNNVQIKLTDDECLNGRKKKDGSRMDKGSGIKSINGLKDARIELEQLGWLHVDTDYSDRARIKRYYSLVIDSDTVNTVTLQNQTLIPNCQEMTPGCQSLTSTSTFTVSKFDTQVSQNDIRSIVDNSEVEKEENKEIATLPKAQVASTSTDIPSQDQAHKDKPKKQRTKSIATPFPPDGQFEVTDAMQDWLIENEITINWQLETKKLKNWALGNGIRKVDWVATWRNWILKAQEQAPKQIGSTWRPGMNGMDITTPY